MASVSMPFTFTTRLFNPEKNSRKPNASMPFAFTTRVFNSEYLLQIQDRFGDPLVTVAPVPGESIKDFGIWRGDLVNVVGEIEPVATVGVYHADDGEKGIRRAWEQAVALAYCEAVAVAAR
jgi:hypothetical protein